MRPDLRRLALRDLLVGRQELERAIQPPRLLEKTHEARLRVDQLRRDAPGDRQRLRLEVVVAQHELRHVVGHVREELVALLHA